MKIFVSGSIHLDILASIIAHPRTIDKPGELSIEVGGTAFNVAVNLAREANHEVTFHSILKNSTIAEILLNELRRHDISTFIEYRTGIADSGFSAHLYNGELVSAVSSIAVGDAEIEVTSELKAEILASAIVIVDCNHSIETLKWFSSFTKDNNIKLVVCAVSEAKSLKLLEIPKPEYTFLNSREFNYLRAHGKKQGRIYTIDDVDTACVFVTNSENGAVAHLNNSITVRVIVEKLPGEAKNFLGAGDAFCAGTVSGLLENKSIYEAMKIGAKFAAHIICSSTCNTTDTNPIGRHLVDVKTKASRDALTNLFLRQEGQRQLQKHIDEHIKSGATFSIIFLDIDHFKRINDTFGHNTGDETLKTLAQIIKHNLRDRDIPVRWGGEEFVLILPGCDEAHACEIGNRLRENLKATVIDNIPYSVTMSLGVAEISSGWSQVHLLEVADQCLYFSKENGRNQLTAYSKYSKKKSRPEL